jgi:DNA-binding NarL/FixJ family response regulator
LSNTCLHSSRTRPSDDSPTASEAAETKLQSARIRVLTVDDHPLLREGIAAIINDQPDMVLEAGASNGQEGIEMFRQHRPDVTLMDLRLPDLSGIDVVIAIRSEFPEARIIILSTFKGDVDIQRALKAGAYGYLLKNTPRRDLIETIRNVHSGKKTVPAEVAAHLAEHMSGEALTEREIDVLRHIAVGGRNKDIAERLFIAEETVKVHVRHIMEKLGANDRTEAMVIAVRRGIIRL